MKRKLIILTVVLVAAAILTLLNRTGEKPETPEFNIILISIDTLRADHLGSYNYPLPTSPAIDGFRNDAVLFGNCMAQSASTLASHGSMFSSMIVSHHGAFFTRSQPLPDSVLTIAEVLKEKNYRTVSFNDGGQIAAEFGMDQGFDLYETMEPKNKNTDLLFDKIVEKTTAWLDKNKKEKFFLFLHTYHVHHPYTPKEEFLTLFDNHYSGKLPRHIDVPLIHKINRGEIELDEQDKKHIIAAYDAEIRQMDAGFHDLVDYLKRNHLYDNTMIIFTSDHGEEFGEHGKWGLHSHTLFRDQLHVPLVIKFPNSQYAGQTVHQLVRSIDILPTLVDLLKDKPSSQFEGTSLMPFVTTKDTKNDIISIAQRDMQKTYNRQYWAVMNYKWKLYDNRLYNLLTDPGELTDASDAAKGNREIKKEMERYAMKFLRRKMNKRPGKKVKLNQELKKKLETLGYIQ